ncbi:hypothetical protein E2C01_030562 [Portunus trituberculatus]|uniref:Uncharacterized protein n=1 Tax=Portunus trituberculatus TaxID=210409 RepID=A0A5B7EVK5_PORTR|nr:hypothetical protein [Portunus trituberculatus]
MSCSFSSPLILNLPSASLLPLMFISSPQPSPQPSASLAVLLVTPLSFSSLPLNKRRAEPAISFSNS